MQHRYLRSISFVFLYLLTHVLWQSVAKFSDPEEPSWAPMLSPAATMYNTPESMVHQCALHTCAC